MDLSKAVPVSEAYTLYMYVACCRWDVFWMDFLEDIFAYILERWINFDKTL